MGVVVDVVAHRCDPSGQRLSVSSILLGLFEFDLVFGRVSSFGLGEFGSGRRELSFGCGELGFSRGELGLGRGEIGLGRGDSSCNLFDGALHLGGAGCFGSHVPYLQS